MKIGLIFPNQLFKQNSIQDLVDKVYLIEDPLFFYDNKTDLKFQKKKLLLHRLSMKSYFQLLNHQKSTYIEYKLAKNGYDYYLPKCSEIVIYDPIDNYLEKRLRAFASQNKCTLTILDNPNFLLNYSGCKNYFEKKERLFFNSFYIEQRKKFDILITKDSLPIQDKWSFDSENRKTYKKVPETKELMLSYNADVLKESIDYVNNNFANHYGDTNNFNYPVNHLQAEEIFNDFIKNKLNSFGPYQDAINTHSASLYHSLISSSLNIGLLDPMFVIKRVESEYYSGNTTIQSAEGFIRQVLGWREYIRGIYTFLGSKQRTKNFFKFSKDIPKEYWNASTKILPIDSTIEKVLKTGYAHHIERLMVLGNFMLLNMFDPNQVYKWFMELFIDSYDWVMVPNVYGMSQYADGGIMSTKPYFSSSSYIKKMSNFKSGEWSVVWDALFWNFVYKHKNILQKNPRTLLIVKNLERLDTNKLSIHLKIAQSFIDNN